MRTFLTLVLVLGWLPALAQPATTVNTLSNLTTRIPKTGETVAVRGLDEAGDWGSPREFKHVPTSVLPTNLVTLAVSGTSTGRWVHTWDSDVRAFGAFPYHPPHTAVPWGYKTEVPAIGTGDFSVWTRMRFPAGFTNMIGLFSIAPRTTYTNTLASPIASTLHIRARANEFILVLRSTNGLSSYGTTIDEGSGLNADPANLSAYLGQMVNLVFTRSGTNVALYFNGTNVTGLFTNSNPAGWAKSIGTGLPLRATSGSQENTWYWPEPVTRFAIWNSALSAGDAADPEAATGKIVDHTPVDVAIPTDAGPGINRAIDYVTTLGGGQLTLPAGAYRISTTIKPKQNTMIRGSGAIPMYPAGGWEGFLPPATVLVPWLSDGGDIIRLDRDDFSTTYLFERYMRDLGGTSATRFARVTLQDFSIYGGLAMYGRGIFLDRVAMVTMQNLGIIHMPGYAIYATSPNGLLISGVTGTDGGLLGRGFHFRGPAADVDISSCFFDGTMGPALWLGGNASSVMGSVFEYTVNPRTAFTPMEMPATADAGTDTFTTASEHRLQTGDVVWFTADTGTLPEPLLEDTEYFAFRVSSTQFKVATNYVDDIKLTGVMNGAGFTDLTTDGVGTWYVGPGPADGMVVSGDNNRIIGNRTLGTFGNSIRLRDANDTRVIGNTFFTAGRSSTNLTGVATIKLQRARQNSIIGNTTDDRYLVHQVKTYATNGIVGDDASFDNFISANSFGNHTNFVPYTVHASNIVNDAKGFIFPAKGSKGDLLIPSTTAFSPFADPRATNTAKPLVYDTAVRRFYLAGDATASAWTYTPTFPYAGPNIWFSDTDGALLGFNGTASGAMIRLIGGAQLNSPMFSIRSYSTNPVIGNSIGLVRSKGANNVSYVPLLSGDDIGRIQFGGYFATNQLEFVQRAAHIQAVASQDWSVGNTGSRFDVYVTESGSSNSAVAVKIKSGGRLGFVQQAAASSTLVEEGDVFYGVSGGLTNLWLRQGGAWIAVRDGGGTSTNYTQFYYDLTNTVVAGSGITVTPAAGKLTIAATAATGPTNGTMVAVDGTPQTTVNLSDGAQVAGSLVGTNWSYEVVDGSLGTNELTSAAYAALVDRSNHTGTQAISTVTNLQEALDAKQPASLVLTNVAALTGGTSTNFLAGDGNFKQVTTNMIPGLNAMLATFGTNSGSGTLQSNVLSRFGGARFFYTNSVSAGDIDASTLTLYGGVTNVYVNGTGVTGEPFPVSLQFASRDTNYVVIGEVTGTSTVEGAVVYVVNGGRAETEVDVEIQDNINVGSSGGQWVTIMLLDFVTVGGSGTSGGGDAYLSNTQTWTGTNTATGPWYFDEFNATTLNATNFRVEGTNVMAAIALKANAASPTTTGTFTHNGTNIVATSSNLTFNVGKANAIAVDTVGQVAVGTTPQSGNAFYVNGVAGVSGAFYGASVIRAASVNDAVSGSAVSSTSASMSSLGGIYATKAVSASQYLIRSNAPSTAAAIGANTIAEGYSTNEYKMIASDASSNLTEVVAFSPGGGMRLGVTNIVATPTNLTFNVGKANALVIGTNGNIGIGQAAGPSSIETAGGLVAATVIKSTYTGDGVGGLLAAFSASSGGIYAFKGINAAYSGIRSNAPSTAAARGANTLVQEFNTNLFRIIATNASTNETVMATLNTSGIMALNGLKMNQSEMQPFSSVTNFVADFSNATQRIIYPTNMVVNFLHATNVVAGGMKSYIIQAGTNATVTVVLPRPLWQCQTNVVTLAANQSVALSLTGFGPDSNTNVMAFISTPASR